MRSTWYLLPGDVSHLRLHTNHIVICWTMVDNCVISPWPMSQFMGSIQRVPDDTRTSINSLGPRKLTTNLIVIIFVSISWTRSGAVPLKIHWDVFLSISLSHWPLGDVKAISKVYFSNTSYEFISWANLYKSSQRLPNTPICQHQWMPC